MCVVAITRREVKMRVKEKVKIKEIVENRERKKNENERVGTILEEKRGRKTASVLPTVTSYGPYAKGIRLVGVGFCSRIERKIKKKLC
jgi:hypothetical protein